MRRLFALLSLLGALSGCRMCASPYDYCGPVVDDNCCGYPGGGPAMGPNQGAPYYENAPAMESAPADGTVIEGVSDAAPQPPQNWSPTPKRQTMSTRPTSR
jgi:hypothetical protein